MFQCISIEQADKMILDESAIVVDIRDPISFAKGHIQGAVRIDNANFHQFVAMADKSKPLIVCCYHGNSSQPAAEVFYQQGFSQSYSMDGGFCEWEQSKQISCD